MTEGVGKLIPALLKVWMYLWKGNRYTRCLECPLTPLPVPCPDSCFPAILCVAHRTHENGSATGREGGRHGHTCATTSRGDRCSCYILPRASPDSLGSRLGGRLWSVHQHLGKLILACKPACLQGPHIWWLGSVSFLQATFSINPTL